MKDIKNKHVFLNFEHLVKRSYSEACILSKIEHYLIFCFQMSSFKFQAQKKELFEKSLDSFSLAVNILKSGTFVSDNLQSVSS